MQSCINFLPAIGLSMLCMLTTHHVSASAQAGDDVKIIWHGHSCFELQSAEGTIIFDPYTGVTGYAPLALKADLVLSSHEHPDHNYTQAVELSEKKLSVEIETIDSYHDDQHGAARGGNRIHIITLQGKRIAHLGDLGTTDLTEDQLRKLTGLDVLMIPVGGHFTIDGPTSAELVKKLNPDTVIPMHYRDGNIDYAMISDISPFLEKFSPEEIIRADTNAFIIGDFHHRVLILKQP